MAYDTPEKKKNREVYKDTVEICKTNSFLQDAIVSTLDRQEIIPETEELVIPESVQKEDSKVIVSNKRTFKAAMDHPEGKIAVLNFASFTKPGGGVAYGSRAQEESISRISTLMQCITDKKCKKLFYEPHNLMNYPLHNDDIIYSPDIVIIKEDTPDQNLLPQDKWKKVDVITCAAPSFSPKPTNRYNPNDGDAPVHISRDQLKELLVKRINRIFEAAYINGAEILILGAYGCGAFRNPPEVVAEAFDVVIKRHKNWFKVIEFAVPAFSGNDNNRVFNEWFGEIRIKTKDLVSVKTESTPDKRETEPIPEIPDLTGQKIIHKTFGNGIIKGIINRTLSVDFKTGKKDLMFEYVFAGPGHLDDKELDDKVYEIARLIKDQA